MVISSSAIKLIIGLQNDVLFHGDLWPVFDTFPLLPCRWAPYDYRKICSTRTYTMLMAHDVPKYVSFHDEDCPSPMIQDGQKSLAPTIKRHSANLEHIANSSNILYTAKTPVLNSTPPVLWEVHTKLVLILMLMLILISSSILTEHVGITIFLLYKKKPGEILIFRTFIAKFWIFAYFTQKSLFSSIFRSGMSLWRHNYVTPWPIVLILVCMDREGRYLPIDTKINFIGGSVWKI